NSIVSRETAKRAIGSESTYTAVNKFRETLSQRIFVPQAPFFHRAGFIVFEQNVGIFQKTQQYVTTLLACQIQCHATLVAINTDKVRRIAFMERRPPITHLIALRRFNFDDICTVISQYLTAIRSAQNPGQIYNFESVQSALSFFQ